jgi:hypothetical protein
MFDNDFLYAVSGLAHGLSFSLMFEQCSDIALMRGELPCKSL